MKHFFTTCLFTVFLLLTCSSFDTNKIQTQVEVVFPSSFSPNNDGKDDLFVPTTLIGVKKIELKIFNRWGNQVFVGTDMQQGWNGFQNKEKAADGTYFWMASYVGIDGNEFTKQGNVTLVR